MMAGARRRLTRQESQTQTRQRLLDAARELFTKQGVNGTSIEQIAEHAGYSRGAFYGNFGDKHQLVAELLTERTRREVQEVRALTETPAPYDALRAWNRERSSHLTDWLALRLELVLYVLRHPEHAEPVAERERIARAAHEQALAHAFTRAHKEPAVPLPFLAAITHALEDGLLIQQQLTPDELGPEVVVDAVQLLVTAWTTSPTPHPDTARSPSEGAPPVAASET